MRSFPAIALLPRRLEFPHRGARPEFTQHFSSAHAVLLLPGVCIRNEGASDETRAPQVQIVGVGDDFWSGGQNSVPASRRGRSARSWRHHPILQHGEIVINESLAAKLGAKASDSIVIHINKPGILPLDAPLGGRKESFAFLRVTVKEIVKDRGLGRFGLKFQSGRAAQRPSFRSPTFRANSTRRDAPIFCSSPAPMLRTGNRRSLPTPRMQHCRAPGRSTTRNSRFALCGTQRARDYKSARLSR